MWAEVLCVGSELLSFDRAETNSLEIARRLIPLGIRLRHKAVVADREDDIRRALSSAVGRSDVIFFTGGLGPTLDDVTREAVAAQLGLDLCEDPALFERLEAFFEELGVPLTANNRRQASIPAGARVLENPRGTAPGLCLEVDGRLVFLLPGPPQELNPMLDQQVIPILEQRFQLTASRRHTLKVAGMGESLVDSRIASICQEYEGIETIVLSSPGIITIHFVARSADNAVPSDDFQAVMERCCAALGRAVYARREVALEEVVAERLLQRGWTIATAESCTGGWVGKTLTDVPGSSRYYIGGLTVYSDSMKSELLDVDSGLLAAEGAVSERVASEMAQNVRRKFGSTLGIATTGIAGPGGGSRQKPVGLVYIALATADRARSRRLRLPGDRMAIRQRTVVAALDWVRRTCE